MTTQNSKEYITLPGKLLNFEYTLDELPEVMLPGTVWHDHKARRWAVVRWWGEYTAPGKLQPSRVELLNLADEKIQEVPADVLYERYKAGQLKTKLQLQQEEQNKRKPFR
jgi:hypothetical protein